MKHIFGSIGIVLLEVLKWIIRIILIVLKLSLFAAKAFLIMFCLVARIFLAFVKVGTV
ncbi:MAG: hypothetical protein ACRC7V_10060 [Lachnospiraceae bacterium]